MYSRALKGHYIQAGYKGLINGQYRLFATEAEYREMVEAQSNFRYFLDTKGIIGDVNDVVNEGDIMEYWNNHYASCPQKCGYSSFDEWWRSVKDQLKEI